MKSPEKLENEELIEFQHKEEQILLVNSKQPLAAADETLSNSPSDSVPETTE